MQIDQSDPGYCPKPFSSITRERTVFTQMNRSFAMKLGIAGKWGGRLLALLLFLFWGAFFVEHLTEWFLRAPGGYPPPRLWISQVLHLVMLIGLAMMLRWDKLGTLVMVIGTAAFFATIHFHHFPFIALINLLPVCGFGVYWMARDQSGK